jgi:hypothetical protein
MKTFYTIILYISFAFIFVPKLTAQSFTPGYYIINSTAEYSIALQSGFDNYTDNSGNIIQYSTEELTMNSGEVVVAFEFSKGKYYCFDPNGRMVVIQGTNCLTSAPMTPGAGVGLMMETISLIDGTDLSEGSYIWIMGQNVANSTVKIQIADGATLDIPQEKVMLYGAFIKNTMKDQVYRKVE